MICHANNAKFDMQYIFLQNSKERHFLLLVGALGYSRELEIPKHCQNHIR